MIYDFDTIVPRRGTASVKWDSAEDPQVIPMWVADMDFKAAPCITEALRKRVDEGVFGYTRVPESYYKSVMDWMLKAHGWKIDRNWILYTTGVVPAISATIKALSSPGDNVLIQTPVYNCFFSSIRNNGLNILENPLKRVDVGDGEFTYEIDFEDFEKKCSDPATSLFLMCSPHNPAGRVWTREELTRIGEICRRHSVTVISDEIHCELTLGGREFIPFAAVSEENQRCSVTFSAASKAFNIAGLQIANIISDDPVRRKLIDRALNINEVCDVNPFGPVALQAAYTEEGAEWLSELRSYLEDNYLFLKGLFKKELPDFPISVLEGTYLVWVDITATGLSSEEIEKSLLENEKVWVNPGKMYGDDSYIRINIACPKATLKEGLDRIVRGLKRLESHS